MMDCADDFKDKTLSSNMEDMKNSFMLNCAKKCSDKHLLNLPSIEKRLKQIVEKYK
ncbi:hypothetical protein A3Q56_08353 [Intoshia linei]|uniref:Uncharacterized protein n=1 Tax=Intoshia linei TaxID=1819745 RepID=A0A177AR04_9BILA|nr:hypothetical protein A3Q56_08353 [Intoshia linei]